MILELESQLSGADLLKGTFGLEREALRIRHDGSLARTPHPAVFGDKLDNPLITIDFSESQLEMITPPCGSLEEAHGYLSTLYQMASQALPGELLWPHSMPCPLQEGQTIPIGRFPSDEAGRQAALYRRRLLEKYGAPRQLICGIHYNFSLSESLVDHLFAVKGGGRSRRDFRDSLYLKLTRNFLRYRWFLIYFLGATPNAHESFDRDLKRKSAAGYYMSLRNSSYGYQNKEPIYPDYSTPAAYAASLRGAIARGIIDEAKEFYCPIRLKAKDPGRILDSLEEDGIAYLEIRSLDLNPFQMEGVSLEDLKFIHLFLLFLLEAGEGPDQPGWQQQAADNETKIVLAGRRPGQILTTAAEGQSLLASQAGEVLGIMAQINAAFSLGLDTLLAKKAAQAQDPDQTLAAKVAARENRLGFAASNLMLAKNHAQMTLLTQGWDQEELMPESPKAAPHLSRLKDLEQRIFQQRGPQIDRSRQ